jgi:hypothetical protein
VSDVGQYGGAHVEAATQILALATGPDFCPLANGVVEMVVNNGCLTLGDERTNLPAMGVGVIQLDALGFLH